MNWYKKSQIEQSEELIGTPNINIKPYEPLVQEVINEIKTENPNFFNNVTDVNIDIGFGQLGSVSNQAPNTINLNLQRIKSDISSQMGISLDLKNPKHLEVLKRAIKETIIHENAHVNDYDPKKGNFPGGESVADRAVGLAFPQN